MISLIVAWARGCAPLEPYVTAVKPKRSHAFNPFSTSLEDGLDLGTSKTPL